MKNKLTALICLLLCIISTNANAIIITPIHNHNHSDLSREAAISLWLATNLFFILYFIIRALIFPMIKHKNHWYDNKWYMYVFNDSLCYDLDMFVGVVAWVFFIINGIALLFTTASWIQTLL